jgi:hypothetical protein
VSYLQLKLAIDDQATAALWQHQIAHYLRSLADQVERAQGAFETRADWPDLEAWSAAASVADPWPGPPQPRQGGQGAGLPTRPG